MVSAEWQELIDKKRADRDALIPEEWRFPALVTGQVSEDSPISAFDLLSENVDALLTPSELGITEANTATSLVSKIAAGELSSYEVALAFCKRAALVHQLVRLCYIFMPCLHVGNGGLMYMMCIARHSCVIPELN
jgi:amidase